MCLSACQHWRRRATRACTSKRWRKHVPRQIGQPSTSNHLFQQHRTALRVTFTFSAGGFAFEEVEDNGGFVAAVQLFRGTLQPAWVATEKSSRALTFEISSMNMPSSFFSGFAARGWIRFIVLILLVILAMPGMARPRVGLASSTCRDLAFEQMVDWAVEQGIREVEVFAGHLDPEAVGGVNAGKKAYLEDKGVRAYAGCYELGADAAKNRRVFELARGFDMDFIVAEVGDPSLWGEIEGLVREFDVRVAIRMGGAVDPVMVRSLLKERDARMGLCLDVDWDSAGGPEVVSLFQDYQDRVWGVHWKEGSLEDGAVGQARLKALAESMKQVDWAGVFALESDRGEVAAAAFIEKGWQRFRELFVTHGFRAGAAKTDITPDKPQPLRGYSNPRISTGVHHRIFHRIVMMDDGEEVFVLISTDLCNVPAVTSDRFTASIARRLGIPRTNVWWSVTHTHSAPYYGSRPSASPPKEHGTKWDSSYDAPVEAALMAGVLEARDHMVPAKLGVGWGYAAANINRRARNADGTTWLGMNPEGPVDRRIGLLRLDEAASGKTLALIANYAMHGTVLGSTNTLITGDAPGYVSEAVEQAIGAPVLYINGAAGNLAPLYSVPAATSSLNHLPRFKVLLADPILDANRRITRSTDEVRLHPRKIHVETPTNTERAWPEALQDYRRSEETSPRVAIPLRSLRINDDILIWALPLELFCEISNEVRDRSPVPYTFYFGYTGGGLGYLPSPEEFPHGGYEVGKTYFTPGTPGLLIDAVLGIAKRKVGR
jgi:neutral ceramidase